MRAEDLVPTRPSRSFIAASFLLVALLPTPAGAAPQDARVDLTGAPVGTVNVEVGGSVTFAGVSAGPHEIVADDGTWTTGPIADGASVVMRFDAAGDYPFHCANHTEERGTVHVSTATVEPPPPPPSNAPPTIRFTAPANGATVKGTVELRMEAADPDAGPDPLGVRVRVDGGAWKTAASVGGKDWTFKWDADAAAPGVHVVEAQALDGAARSDVASLRLQVESAKPPPKDGEEPPRVSIERPDDGAKVFPTDVLVSGRANPGEGGSSKDLVIEVSVDGGDWREARGTSEWIFVWNAAEAGPGSHVLSARARDGDLTSDVAAITVVVDEPGGGFIPPTDTTPGGGPASAGGWKAAALDFGWVAIALLALSGAWAWASSRP